jgi:hemolysin III
MYPGERLNGYSHLLGLLLALPAAALLLAKTVPTGDPARIAGALVFSLSAVALYAASTLFHSTRGRLKRMWERADHCAIYLLIAGTYTPFALVTLQGVWGGLLLAIIWRRPRAARPSPPRCGCTSAWVGSACSRPCRWPRGSTPPD